MEEPVAFEKDGKWWFTINNDPEDTWGPYSTEKDATDMIGNYMKIYGDVNPYVFSIEGEVLDEVQEVQEEN